VPGELGDDLEPLAAVGEQRAEGVTQDVRRAPVLGQGPLGVGGDELVQGPRDERLGRAVAREGDEDEAASGRLWVQARSASTAAAVRSTAREQ
jgi:hypothetical protein